METEIDRLVEWAEDLYDWSRFGPQARKAMAVAYSKYIYSLLAAFPFCVPFSGQPMLCNDRQDHFEHVVSASAGSVAISLPGVTVVVTTTNTDSPNSSFIHPL
jgi:hypothetical protein